VCLHAVGKMDGYELPTSSWLPSLLRHSQPLLTSMTPVQLANFSWGLGALLQRQGVKTQLRVPDMAPPSLTWQHAFAAAAQQHIQSGAMDAEMVDTMCGGLQVWGMQRSDERMQALWLAAQQQLQAARQQQQQQLQQQVGP
jgi:hypothetical protein